MIAKDYGVEMLQLCSPAFKYIAEKMRLFETQTNGPVLYSAAKKAYGYS